MSIRISIIAGIGKNRELGKGGDLIWRIPSDLKRVKALTMGHTLIMGRKTYESIGKPLPGRTTIVVSRTAFDIPGAIVVHSFENALTRARGIEREKKDGEIFIFGGAQIYAAALPNTERLYLTLIEAEDPAADAFFPEYGEFKKVIEEKRQDGDPAYTLRTLERAI